MTTFETNALEINDLNKNYPGFSPESSKSHSSQWMYLRTHR